MTFKVLDPENGKKARLSRQTRTYPGAKQRDPKPSCITISPDQEFPPEMAALSEARKKFVIAYVTCPGRPNSEYAKMAGLGGNPNTQKSAAWELLHTASVIDAIRAYQHHVFGAAVPLATKTVIGLIKNKNPKIQLKAIEIVLAHGGMQVAQKIEVKHEHSLTNLSTEDLIARRAKLREQLMIEAPKQSDLSSFVTEKHDTIEAEFSEAGEAA